MKRNKIINYVKTTLAAVLVMISPLAFAWGPFYITFVNSANDPVFLGDNSDLGSSCTHGTGIHNGGSTPNTSNYILGPNQSVKVIYNPDGSCCNINVTTNVSLCPGGPDTCVVGLQYHFVNTAPGCVYQETNLDCELFPKGLYAKCTGSADTGITVQILANPPSQ